MHTPFTSSLVLSTSTIKAALSAAAAFAVCGVARGQTIETVYTKISGHASAQVPGPVDLNGAAAVSEWKALEGLVLSPRGERWMLRGRTNLGAALQRADA